jgi:ABC-2 type transport system ATP-binding protein
VGAAPVACRALTKRYGELVAVDRLDLELAPGSVTGFLGPNGAGKSTTLRMLVGLTRPTGGRAEIAGRDARDPTARASVGYMPADPAFYPALTGRENLDLLAALHGGGAPDRAWATRTIELTDAELDRRVGGYSSGMRQKLALVQAVQHRPDLVVLDEPANRLDPLAHRRFEALVREIAGAGRTVLLSSHTLPEVEDVCDSVAMIRRGRLLAHRPVGELAGMAQRRVRAVYADGVPAPPPGLEEPQTEDHALTGRVARGRADVLRALVEAPGLVDLVVEPASLEDAFYALYAADDEG